MEPSPILAPEPVAVDPKQILLVAISSWVQEEEEDNDGDDDKDLPVPAIKAPDLQLMDLNGNVVRVFKGMAGTGTVCTSVDDLICVTGGTPNGAHVLDPTTGKMLMACSNIEARPLDKLLVMISPYFTTTHDKDDVVTPYFTTFGFGRAGPSRAYKAVRLSDAGAFEVLTLGDGARWRPTNPPPRVVPNDRGPPVSIRGVMYFLIGKKQFEDPLLRFDLESEQWEKRPMEGPRKLVSDEEWEKTSEIRLRELNSDLCMVQSLLKNTVNPRTNIWLLTDPNLGTWIKMYTIKMAPGTYRYTPLMVHGDGRLLLHCTTGCSFSYESRASPRRVALQLYDPCTETCKDVAKMPENLIKRISICRWSLDGPV